MLTGLPLNCRAYLALFLESKRFIVLVQQEAYFQISRVLDSLSALCLKLDQRSGVEQHSY